MRIQQPDPTPRENGDYKVDDTPGYGKPHADIWLDEKGDLRLRWVDEGDCERLIRAAAETLERLRRHKAMAAAPHGRSSIYQGTCQLCGKPEDDELHAEPAAPKAAVAVADDGQPPFAAVPRLTRVKRPADDGQTHSDGAA